MLPAMPRPWHAALWQQDRQVRLGCCFPLDQAHLINVAIGGEPRAIVIGVGHGGREGNALQVWRKRLQPRERQAEQITALTIGKGVDLIDDDAFQRGEHVHAVFMAEQQRQRFRCGQQYVRRLDPLPCFAVR